MGGSQVFSLFLAPNRRITEGIPDASPDAGPDVGPDAGSQAGEGIFIMRTGVAAVVMSCSEKMR